MTACTSIDLEGGKVLYGGPEGGAHQEHEHPQSQLTIHVPEQYAFGSRAKAWIVPGGMPHKGSWKPGTISMVFLFSDAMLDEGRAIDARSLASREIRDALILELGIAAAAEVRSPWRDPLFFSSAHYLAARQLTRGSRGAANRSRDPVAAKLMMRLRDLAETSIERPLSVPEMARALGTSPQRLTRQLQAATGLSPHQYITAMRIERSKGLLRNRLLSLAEISFLVGFASQSHFTAVFRRHVGVTPRVYRRSVAG